MNSGCANSRSVGRKLFRFLVGCLAFALAGLPLRLSAGPAVITVAPAVAGVRAGSSQQFLAVVGATSGPVVWSVNGIVGGNAVLGTVTSSGLFTSPISDPGMPIHVTAAITNPVASISATVGWQNPVPQISLLNPAAIHPGTNWVVIGGNGFGAGAQVVLNGVMVVPTTVSSNSITVPIAVTNPGSATVAVWNPPPGASASSPVTLKILPPVTVSVSAPPGGIRLGTSQAISATVANSSDTRLVFSVNGVVGGSIDSGWIDASGMYSAPSTMPSATSVRIRATSLAYPDSFGETTVSLLNPVPVIRSLTPAVLNYGVQTVTMSGTGFVPGSQLVVGTNICSIELLSPTVLSATLNVAPTSAGVLAFRVVNPDPGSAVSGLWVQPVEAGSPQVTYLAAARFLEQASWGPNAASIAHLQSIGFDAWLDEQLAAPPSFFTPTADASNNLNTQQCDFIGHALTGSDQLRQRVAFALSQIFVVSAFKTGEPRQMVPYYNLLLSDALGTYSQLVQDVTLSPVMGVYLDMVNNDKANPATGASANENYGRELMQLFSIGTQVLNPDGTVQLDVNGQAIPTYDPGVIGGMARALTGWTFPGPQRVSGHNSESYDGPMIAVESNHDTGGKSILNGNYLPPGQTARQDLQGVFQAILSHPNLAPFVSIRLIQHLVESNPSPDYVARVSQVFSSTGGDLNQVVRAILLDPEARQGDDPAAPVPSDPGHLREPLYYILGILRSLDGQVLNGHPVEALGQVMGQHLFYSPTVFNYYSPMYQVAGGVPGPEFQLVSSATAVVRANSVFELITKQLNGAVQFDWTAFTSLAASPSDLIDAVDHALLYRRLPAEAKAMMIPAMQATNDPLLRVRTAVFLIATSGFYQVQH